MALEEKKYLDLAGVGIIKTYIDQQDTVNNSAIEKVASDLAAEVKRSTEADTAHSADIAANTAAIGTAKAEVIGTAADTADKDTIKGAKAYADAAVAVEKQRAEGKESENAQAAANALAEAQAKVASVSAGDKSVTVGGTATAPTVAVNLSTTAGNNLVVDDNGLYVNVPAAAEYSIVKDETSSDYAAVYHLTKNGVNVGSAINIPKDMVLQSGRVEGDKLILVLNNADNTEIEIEVGSLIEYVTSGSAEDDMVVITVDETTHKVTATITDGKITKAKLEADVQTTLNKADSALQKADIVTGENNGTIKVKDTEVSVAGLGSAAYTDSSAYDVNGAAAEVYAAIIPYTEAEIKAIFPISE